MSHQPMRTSVAVVAAIGSAALTDNRLAQQSQRRPRLAARRLKSLPVHGNVYMFAGAGGNIAVSVGRDGVLVVDSGHRGDERQGDRGHSGSWQRQ